MFSLRLDRLIIAIVFWLDFDKKGVRDLLDCGPEGYTPKCFSNHLHVAKQYLSFADGTLEEVHLGLRCRRVTSKAKMLVRNYRTKFGTVTFAGEAFNREQVTQEGYRLEYYYSSPLEV